jgi:hypothetical protein
MLAYRISETDVVVWLNSDDAGSSFRCVRATFAERPIETGVLKPAAIKIQWPGSGGLGGELIPEAEAMAMAIMQARGLAAAVQQERFFPNHRGAIVFE